MDHLWYRLNDKEVKFIRPFVNDFEEEMNTAAEVQHFTYFLYGNPIRLNRSFLKKHIGRNWILHGPLKDSWVFPLTQFINSKHGNFMNLDLIISAIAHYRIGYQTYIIKPIHSEGEVEKSQLFSDLDVGPTVFYPNKDETLKIKSKTGSPKNKTLIVERHLEEYMFPLWRKRVRKHVIVHRREFGSGKLRSATTKFVFEIGKLAGIIDKAGYSYDENYMSHLFYSPRKKIARLIDFADANPIKCGVPSTSLAELQASLPVYLIPKNVPTASIQHKLESEIDIVFADGFVAGNK